MNSTLKKTLIISAAALAAAAVAVAAVLFILKAGSHAADARLDNPPSSSSSAVQAVSSEPPAPVDNGIRLVISSPEKSVISVTAPEFTFSGTSDREEPLTVNGTAIERTEDGSFTYSVNLNVGKNVFAFEHKGETKTYTVNYRYVIIESYSPSKAQTYPSGATLVVNVKARRGSSVTAAFNGKTITLTAADNSNDEKSDFISFNGVFELPKDNAQDINLGKIVFKATHAGKSESFSSGAITCKKSDVIVDYDPKATPTGGRYMNVGSGYIAEIVGETAETFDGNVSAASLKNGSVDWSRPTNNYLPCGTVDYSSPNPVIYESGSVKNEYVTLRAGYRVYKQTRDKPNTGYKQITKQYIGTLPDHNEIKAAVIENGDTHTVLTVNTDWKAPFYFDLLPQAYANPSTQNYNVSSVTFRYIDITFCYATVFEGEIAIPEDNPLFERAEVIKNMNAGGTAVRDYTLRLFLKKQGAFYGWDCAYNKDGQLVFTFLNPRKITAADNEYGFNLNGAKIPKSDIIFKLGYFGGIKRPEPRFVEAQYALAVAFKYRLYRGVGKGGERKCRKRAALIRKTGNAVGLARGVYKVVIPLRVPRYYYKITVAVIFRPHKAANISHGELRFLRRSVRGADGKRAVILRFFGCAARNKPFHRRNIRRNGNRLA